MPLSLFDSEDQFRRLFECAPGNFLVLSPDEYRIIAVSDGYLASTLTRRKDLVGQLLFDQLSEQRHGEPADGVRNLRASLDRVCATRQRDELRVPRYEVAGHAMERADVEERLWNSVNVPVISDDGQMWAIIHSIKDVTDIVAANATQAEASDPDRRGEAVLEQPQELPALGDRLAVGETMLEMKGRIARIGAWVVFLPELRLVWSPQTYRLHGLPFGEGPPVETAIDYYRPAYRSAITDAVERCVRDGTPFDLIAELQPADRPAIWVRSIGEAVRDASGAISHIQGTIQDISDRIAAEHENALLSNRLRDTLESITDGFVTLDAEWCFTYINAEAERLMQRSRAELIGRNVWAEFPDAVGSQYELEYRRAVAEKRAVNFEAYYPPLGVWTGVRAYPSSGGLTVYFQDITERRRADQQLRLLQTCVERLNDIILITEAEPIDEPGPRTVYVNDAFERRTGYTREEVLGRTPRILQGPGTSRAELDRIRHALTAWEPVRAELMNYTKDGSPIWLELDIVPVADDTGHYTHWIAVERDITARREAEERLRLQARLIDSTTDAILVRDLEQRVQFWNAGATRLYGWTEEEVLGRQVSELIYADGFAMENATEQLLATGSWAGDLEQVTREGVKVLVEARWTLLRGEDGVPSGFLEICSDVTDRRRFEQQLLRTQRLESIGTLAGGIAHDLNNILAPILLATDLMRLQEPDARRRETIDTIHESARRGAEMVSQVLSFARGVDGERMPVRVADLVEVMSRIMRDTFPKNLQVSLEIEADLPDVLGDATQLHQVLMNLLVNARDAMPDGGTLRLAVSVVELDSQYAAMNVEAKPGRYVRLEVEDTGQGIPAADMDKLFDPFFTTKPIGEGTGLGLSTALAIVKSHDGFIRAYSDAGVGTVMRVYLPVIERAGLLAVAEPSSDFPRGSAETILVVDDEQAIRQITAQTLEAFGYRCLLAADGAEAVALYAERQTEIAVVITDMMMPVMDGLATIRVLQRINPAVRIIAASGITANDKVAQAAGEGVRHFLPKPYTAQTLLRALQTVLLS